MKAMLPICQVCRHFDRDANRCEVFPDGLPADILEHRADHRWPYPGDGGIRFEPNQELDPELVQRRLDLEDLTREKLGLGLPENAR